jgi:hypothetical protein
MESFEPPLDALDAVVEMGEHRSGLVDARHPGAACCERVASRPTPQPRSRTVAGAAIASRTGVNSGSAGNHR